MAAKASKSLEKCLKFVKNVFRVYWSLDGTLRNKWQLLALEDSDQILEHFRPTNKPSIQFNPGCLLSNHNILATKQKNSKNFQLVQ